MLPDPRFPIPFSDSGSPILRRFSRAGSRGSRRARFIIRQCPANFHTKVLYQGTARGGIENK